MIVRDGQDLILLMIKVREIDKPITKQVPYHVFSKSLFRLIGYKVAETAFFLEVIAYDYGKPLKEVEKDYNDFTEGNWEIIKWRNKNLYNSRISDTNKI